MKKSKFLILVSLILIVIIASCTFLVACKDDASEDGSGTISGSDSGSTPGDDPDTGEGVVPPIPPRPIIPPPPQEDLVVTYGAFDSMKKIVNGLDVPEGHFALNIYADADVVNEEGENKKYRVALRANLQDEVNNELVFTVLDMTEASPISLENIEILDEKTASEVFGIYVRDEDLYISLGDGVPLLYVSDFDMNYLISIITKALDKLDLNGLINSLPVVGGNGIEGVLSLVIGLICPQYATSQTIDGVEYVELDIALNSFISMLKALVGMLNLSQLVGFDLNLNPLFELLNSSIPQMKITLKSSFDAETGKTLSANLEVIDKDTNNLITDGTMIADIGLFAKLTEENQGIYSYDGQGSWLPEKVKYATIDSTSDFSFTNINFDIDLFVDTPTKVDIAKVINTFTGEQTLPENLIILDISIGLRLSITLDLNLYQKIEESVEINEQGEPVTIYKDLNKIAIELYLLEKNAHTNEFEPIETEPQLGVYYYNRAMYLNLSNLLPNYYDAGSIKLNVDLASTIDVLIEKLTGLIDGALGTNYQEIKNLEVVRDNTSTLSTAALTASNSTGIAQGSEIVDTLALKVDEYGNYTISTTLVGFIQAIGSVVGFSKFIQYTDDNKGFKIVANSEFYDAIQALAGSSLGFTWPEDMLIELSVNCESYGIDNIAIDAKVLGINAQLKIGNFLIGYEPGKNLDKYLNHVGSIIGGKEYKDGFEAYILKHLELDNYTSSVSSLLETILTGVNLSIGLKISFGKGIYNLAPLIAKFGLTALADSKLLWEFTDNFVLDASLNVAISLDKLAPENSRLIVEIVTNQTLDEEGNPTGGIYIGSTELFKPGSVILGLYGIGNEIYVKLDELRLLNIKLPNLYVGMNYTDLVFSLLGEKEIFDLSFDLAKIVEGLFNGNSGEDNGSETNGQSINAYEKAFVVNETTGQEEMTAVTQLVVALNTDGLSISLALNTIQALLEALNVQLPEGLNLGAFPLGIDINLSRLDGLTFAIKGDLVEMYDPASNKNAYSEESDLVIELTTGTSGNPIKIGDISSIMSNKYQTRLDSIIADSSNYYDDLIQAIVQTIGKARIVADIDLTTFENDLNITKIINNFLASQGTQLTLPINLALDNWGIGDATKLQLAVEWKLDLNDFKQTAVLLEFSFEEKIIMQIAIYRNSIIVDLTGLGLFNFEITNSPLVALIVTELQSLISQLGELSLTDLINGLLTDLVGGIGSGSGETENASIEQTNTVIVGSEAAPINEETGTVTEETGSTNAILELLLGYVLPAIKVEDCVISVGLTNSILDTIFRELIGFSLGISIDASAVIDFLQGKAELGLNVENALDLGVAISLQLGQDFDIVIDTDTIPDWNAINGKKFTKSLLDNLNIRLYLDIANSTGDSASVAGGPMYTRVIIEKLDSNRSLPNSAQSASRGSFLVTLASIDEARYNNSNQGTMTPLVYLELNYNTGKLLVTICSGVINFVVDIGDTIGQIAVDLDLVTMLAGTFDNLFQSVDDIVNDLSKGEVSLPVEEETTEVPETPVFSYEYDPYKQLNGTLQVVQYYSTNTMSIKTSEEFLGEYRHQVDTDYWCVVEQSGDTYTQHQLTYSIADTLPELTIDNIDSMLYSVIAIQQRNENNELVYELNADGTNNTSAPIYNYYIPYKETRLIFGWRQVSEVNGISALFGRIDILGMLDGGINISLTNTATFNLNVNINAYIFNKLIDDLMFCIFGPETILDLGSMIGGSEDKYLDKVYWNRTEKDAFWNSLKAQLSPILCLVLKSMAGISVPSGLVDTLAGSVYTQVRKLTTRLLPLPVYNNIDVGLNIIDGTFSNIYVKGDDNNETVYDSNGLTYSFWNGSKNLSYASGSSGRSDNYYTYIGIYNVCDSVGEDLRHDGIDDTGIVTWNGVSKEIVYDPYNFASAAEGKAYLIKEYFTNKNVSYQKADNLYKTDVTFKILKYTDANGVVTNYADDETSNIENINIESAGGVYEIEATASFASGAVVKKLICTLNIRSNADIDHIEGISMHAYASLPDYISVFTKDGIERRFATKDLTIYTNNEAEGIVFTGSSTYKSYEAHEETVIVKFKNGISNTMKINIVDSTVKNVKLLGAENLKIDINLYEFNENSTLADYTPEVLYSNYNDGSTTLANAVWNVGNAEEVFDRLDNQKSGEDLSCDRAALEGARYKIIATIAEGTTLEQDIEIVFIIKTKIVQGITFGKKTDSLKIDPYQYYQSLVSGDENASPFSPKVKVNYLDSYEFEGTTYEDNYSEDVYVKWVGLTDGLDYSWDNDNSPSSKSVKVVLDDTKYTSGNIFKWSYDKVKVTVNRNEILAVYFDEKLTQDTFIIDPYKYNSAKNWKDNYPEKAYVKFTNGSVYELPIAWDWNKLSQFDVRYVQANEQFMIHIGYDPDKYALDGTIVDYAGMYGDQLQSYVVNVAVDGLVVEDYLIDGSSLREGTYYEIDPLNIIYKNENIFGTTIDVQYTNGTTATLPIYDIEFDASKIDIYGNDSLTARIYVSQNVYRDIKVKVLSRNLKSTQVSYLDSITINPYEFTTINNKRVWSEFEDSWEFKFEDSYSFLVYDSNRASNILFAKQFDTKTELEAFKDEFFTEYVVDGDGKINYNGTSCLTKETTNYISYELPVTWDLSKVNFGYNSSASTATMYVGEGTEYQLSFKVKVNVLSKIIDCINSPTYIFTVTRDGLNLSKDAQESGIEYYDFMIMFKDGTSTKLTAKIDFNTASATDACDESTGFEVAMDDPTRYYSYDSSINEDLNGDGVVNRDDRIYINKTRAPYYCLVTIFEGEGTLEQSVPMKFHVYDLTTMPAEYESAV